MGTTAPLALSRATDRDATRRTRECARKGFDRRFERARRVSAPWARVSMCRPRGMTEASTARRRQRHTSSTVGMLRRACGEIAARATSASLASPTTIARRGVRATTSARAGMGPAVEPVEAPTSEVRRPRRSSARERDETTARWWFYRSTSRARTTARARGCPDDGRAIERSGFALPLREPPSSTRDRASERRTREFDGLTMMISRSSFVRARSFRTRLN